MRAALYFRQSEDRTGEEWGIDRQRDDVMRLVQARGWTVVQEFRDNDISAYSGKPRPDFNRMLRMVEQGEVDVIVAKHMDRLLRRLRELEDTLDRCAGKAFIVTTADGVDTSTEGGRLVARILSSVAQGEVERKGARQKAAARQAAEQGRWIGGRRPFGYQRDLSIDPIEAAIVCQLYSKLIAGESLYSMAKWLNAQEVKTTVGNRWTGDTVGQMLARPRYAGLRTYHGEVVGKGQWDSLVAEDTWRTALGILTTPGRQVAPTGRKHLLSGLLLCGGCTKPVSSGFNLNPIYRCKHCAAVSRKMEPIDRLSQKLIVDFMTTDDAQELLIDRSRADVGQLRERERVLLDSIDQLAIDHTDGLLNARQVKVATDRLQTQLDEVQANLRRGGKSEAVKDLVCKNPAPIWKRYSLDRRRMVISEVVEFTLRVGGKGSVFKPEHLGYRWLLAEE